MTKGLIALCLLLAVQAIAAYEVAVPVYKQPFGASDSTRIIGGKTATPGQFPHQAGITIDDRSFCGGSLISHDFILTAAHCVYGREKWAVVLGAQNIRDQTEPGRVTLTSRKGTYYEKFNPFVLKNDVGVIELPEKVTLNAQINVIPLPPRSYQNEDFTGETVRVSGWGKTSDDSLAISPTLQYVDLTIGTLDECRSVFGPTVATNKIYCINTPQRKSPCNGDSGGSLTIGSGKNFTNLGIVSFGSNKGCALGFPAGFTATTHFVDWISSKTGIPVRN